MCLGFVRVWVLFGIVFYFGFVWALFGLCLGFVLGVLGFACKVIVGLFLGFICFGFLCDCSLWMFFFFLGVLFLLFD